MDELGRKCSGTQAGETTPGRVWGRKVGSRALVLPSRNMEGVGDSGPLSCRPIFCCQPSSEALASRNSTLAYQEHSASLLALPVSISSLHGASSQPTLLPLVDLTSFLWAMSRGRIHAGNCDRQALAPTTWSLLSPGLE